MWILDPVKVPKVGRQLADMMLKVSLTGGPAQVRDYLETVSNGNVAHLARDRTEAAPGYAIFQTPTSLWVFVEGCNSLRHGTDTAAGYPTGPLQLSPDPVHPYFTYLANLIYTDVLTFPSWNGGQVRLIGHSLGGATVEALALQMRPSVARDRLQVCTYGAPKCGGSGFCHAVSAYPHARWFNSDDPVPLVFPTASDNLGMLFLFNLAQHRRINAFTHPAGGLELLPSGTIRGAPQPSDASVDAVTNIAAWLVAIDRGLSTPHDLDAYLQRFDLWLARGYVPSENPRPSMVVESKEEIVKAHFSKQQESVVKAMRAKESVQRNTTAVIPDTLRPQVEKLAKLYRVTWGGQLVVGSTNARTARKLKNQINDLMETLLEFGLVDPGTLRSQFDHFLNQAQAPGSGIQPQIPTAVGS